MREDTLGFLRREVTSDDRYNKYDGRKQEENLDRVINKETQGVCEPRAVIKFNKVISYVGRKSFQHLKPPELLTTYFHINISLYNCQLWSGNLMI